MSKDDAAYVPAPEKVAALVAKHTPEQLAAAYLKAARRAKDADLTKTLTDTIATIIIGLVQNDKDMVKAAAERGLKAIRTHEQTR